MWSCDRHTLYMLHFMWTRFSTIFEETNIPQDFSIGFLFYKVKCHGERKAPTRCLTQFKFQFQWKEKISPLEGTEGTKNPHTTLYTEQLIAVLSTQGFAWYHCCAVYFYNRRQFDSDRLCLMAPHHFIVHVRDSPRAGLTFSWSACDVALCLPRQ